LSHSFHSFKKEFAMGIFHLFGGRGRRMGLLVVLALCLILTALPTAALAAPAYSGPYHIVKHGETLSQIAKSYGVTLWALAEHNGISDPNYIYVGQCLYIPPAGSGYHGKKHQGGYEHDDYGWKDDGWKDDGWKNDGWKDNGYDHNGYGWKDDDYKPDHGYKPTNHGGGYGKCSAWHYVRKGDILGKIAKWYGSNSTAIAKVNGIANPSLIYVGQKLCIPSPWAHGGHSW
jgi:LysM repeat protein